jgi:hypothetical protein
MSVDFDFLNEMLGIDRRAFPATSTGGRSAGGKGNGVSALRPARASRRMTSPRRFTGASTHGSSLFVMTLDICRSGNFRCNHARSGSLELTGRDQNDVLAFDRHLRSLVRRGGISRLTLRGAPQTGDYRANPAAYKIEAIVQLLPHVAIEIVAPQRVDPFVAKRDLDLPEPDCAMSASERRGFGKASSTAAFAALGGLDLHELVAEGITRD